MLNEVSLEIFEFELRKIAKYYRNSMLSEARQNKIMEKLNVAQKLNFGTSKPGVKGGLGPPGSTPVGRSKRDARDAPTMGVQILSFLCSQCNFVCFSFCGMIVN